MASIPSSPSGVASVANLGGQFKLIERHLVLCAGGLGRFLQPHRCKIPGGLEPFPEFVGVSSRFAVTDDFHLPVELFPFRRWQMTCPKSDCAAIDNDVPLGDNVALIGFLRSLFFLAFEVR